MSTLPFRRSSHTRIAPPAPSVIICPLISYALLIETGTPSTTHSGVPLELARCDQMLFCPERWSFQPNRYPSVPSVAMRGCCCQPGAPQLADPPELQTGAPG